MSQVYNITAEDLRAAGYRPLHAGDSYNHRFTVTRASVALDLSGSTKIWLTVKDDPIVADAESQLQISTDDPTTSSYIEITDAANGKFTVHFLGSGSKSTENLEGEWDYDIQVKLDSDEVITICNGKIEFLPNITRSTS